MAQISTQDLEVTAVQNSIAQGSEVTSNQMMGFTIALVFIGAVLIMTLVVSYNTQAIRDDKVSQQTIAKVIKRIIFAISIYIITNLLIGVFYAI